MTLALRFAPEVEEDAFVAYQWYESKAKGLGEAFLRLFYSRAAQIAEDPAIYPKVQGKLRRCLLKRFPYAVYFTFSEGTVSIYGLFHCARAPGFLESELRQRTYREQV